MITRKDYESAQRRASHLMRKAGLRVSGEEEKSIEVVDFGLSRLHEEGVQVLTLVQTERISVKVLALFPFQTEPEHWHPPVGNDPGKEETIRVIDGTVYFFVPGPDTLTRGFIPKGKESYYTTKHEIIMKPSDQITLEPGKKHWFQALDGGAVMFSFSTVARDALDKFADPNIVRITEIEESLESQDRPGGVVSS
jgi:D-lyxose ketol-isomerase